MNKKESLLKKLYNTILDLLFPEEGMCFLCEKYDEDIGDDHICEDCKEQIKFIDSHICKICGKPLEIGYIPNKCPDCIKHPHFFATAVAAVEYEGLIKKSIYKYKYGKKAYMYKAFGHLMVQAIIDKDIKGFNVIVPVPLHRDKRVERGFNQSELLAKYISDEFDVPLDFKNLRRIKKTSVQNKLHRLQRQQNIKDAFRIKNPNAFKDKIVLLVDDILTTGATADECSKMLLENGADKIYVISIGTGRNINM
jgi:ComF family protein